jgi:hypothetical protein
MGGIVIGNIRLLGGGRCGRAASYGDSSSPKLIFDASSCGVSWACPRPPGSSGALAWKNQAGSAEYSLRSVSCFTVSPHRPSSCSTSPQARGAAWTLKHAGQDDDGSDAICRAGRFARPDGRDPLVRPNPDGDARRPSLSLLPPDDDGQCGGAQGLLRRLASFPQGLVTAGPIRVRGAFAVRVGADERGR